MKKPTAAPGKFRRLLRTLAIGLGALVVLLGLLIIAFVYNPMEGSVADLRDVVPRGVDFFVRKEGLADDFDEFPAPRFWPALAEAPGFAQIEKGPALRGVFPQGVAAALQEVTDQVARLQQDSGGQLDVLRDLIGTELIVAGYQQDYGAQPPRPLAAPWWCVYTRVSWRIRAAFGVFGLGIGRDQLAQNGVEITPDGDRFSIKLRGNPGTFWCQRHLDVVMFSNHQGLLEQTQRLLDGNRDEEPLGKMAAYTDAVVGRTQRWADLNSVFDPEVVEFVAEPSAFDGFRRFAASWPNPTRQDSMNERVLASFLNLKGWRQLAGALLFADQSLSVTGQVLLNSKQHTPFQGSFYKAEKQRREEWLDPFLAMVPDSACAAAALRMPAGEFVQAMFQSLEPPEQELLNEPIRRSTLQNQPLNGMLDLIGRISVALLPRTGFVFRKNVPDTQRDKETGELLVPVTARSPMPQVAWVFWLRPGMGQVIDDTVKMLMNNYAAFGFRKMYHLHVPYAGNNLPEPVTEFCNPQIPATGEVAMIVFRDFFVVSNSGPLIKDILRTRYQADGQRSIRSLEEFATFERELPGELNGLLWLRGKALGEVMDDYRNFAEVSSELPDPEWMMQSRPAMEEQVRRTRFAQYPSKASMPKSMLEPGGDFDNAVVAALHEKWKQQRSSFTAADREQMVQLRAFADLIHSGYLQLELENNYIRFQGKLLGNLR